MYTESLSFFDPCGFVNNFWGTKFSFQNWKYFQSRSIYIVRLVRDFSQIFGKFICVRMRGSSGEVGAGRSSGHAGSRFPTHRPTSLTVACKHADMYASFRLLTCQWAWGLMTF